MGSKGHLKLLPVALVFAIVALAFVAAATREGHVQRGYIIERFYLESVTDGKLEDTKRIVELKILASNGQRHVWWDGVNMFPVHERKKVMLGANHYSTKEGTVSDVVVGENHFSFRLHLSPLFAQERTLQVVGERKAGESKYSLRAVGLWRSDLLENTMKVEWRSTKEGFVLAYKDVF
jgi:hypothetical protein